MIEWSSVNLQWVLDENTQLVIFWNHLPTI